MAEGVVDSNLETPKAQIVNRWVGVQMEQWVTSKSKFILKWKGEYQGDFKGERYTPHKYTSLYYFGIMWYIPMFSSPLVSIINIIKLDCDF
jgi:hypothetical protein